MEEKAALPNARRLASKHIVKVSVDALTTSDNGVAPLLALKHEERWGDGPSRLKKSLVTKDATRSLQQHPQSLSTNTFEFTSQEGLVAAVPVMSTFLMVAQ